MSIIQAKLILYKTATKRNNYQTVPGSIKTADERNILTHDK